MTEGDVKHTSALFVHQLQPPYNTLSCCSFLLDIRVFDANLDQSSRPANSTTRLAGVSRVAAWRNASEVLPPLEFRVKASIKDLTQFSCDYRFLFLLVVILYLA